MAYIGLDIGTSAVKALLVDETEATLAHASEPLATAHPHPLWSEQDPEIWWRAALAGAPVFVSDGIKSISASPQDKIMSGPDG